LPWNNQEARKASEIETVWSRHWLNPAMTFAGQDLYPTVVEKAAALCFSLFMNRPFVDGNKIHPKAAATLKPGKNVISVRCRQTTAGSARFRVQKDPASGLPGR